MAQECTESSSVAVSSSTPPNLWEPHHASSLSSWSNSSQWHQPNPSSNSSCEEDVSNMSTSFTNASSHSGLTVESSRRLVEPSSNSNELMGEHASDSQLWSHFLFGTSSNGDLHNTQDVGENLLEALSSKSMSSGMFEPACDYLKKMDNNNWEFTNTSSFSNFETRHLNGFNDQSLIESERLTKLSNLVSNWSIAPPDQEISRQFDPRICNISLSSSAPQTFSSGSTSCVMGTNRSNLGFLSSFDHDHMIKVKNEHGDMDAPGVVLGRSFNGNDVGYQIGLNGSLAGNNSKYHYTAPEVTYTSSRNFADVLSFSSRFTKPLIDSKMAKPSITSLNLSDGRKQGIHSSSLTRRGHAATNEGKKKRSEDTSETIVKKPKHENSTVASPKVQATKVKLGEKITTLQQIVSPFGKTDTASVLYEAIQYIKFLQEQVQLLSDPYMKSNPHKEYPWGGLDRKDHNKGDAKLDLRSKGLCLVPTSSTRQLCHENTDSDYWTPTYRGCLYR